MYRVVDSFLSPFKVLEQFQLQTRIHVPLAGLSDVSSESSKNSLNLNLSFCFSSVMKGPLSYPISWVVYFYGWLMGWFQAHQKPIYEVRQLIS